MNKMFIMLSLLSLFFYSCSTKEEKSNNVIRINLDSEDNVSVFDLVDSITVIPLEAKKESFFKMIKDVILYKNKVYIFDRISQKVFCFDQKGKFLSKIDNRGRGPGEYVYAYDFKVDKFNDRLMILVPWGSVFYYDLDCKFISKIDLPDEIKDMFEFNPVNKETLMFFSWKNNEYKSFYYSITNGKITSSPLFSHSTQEQHLIFWPFNNTYYYNDSLYYNEVSVNNDVINLSDTTQKISYSWDFGERNNTQKQVNEAISYVKKISQREGWVYDNRVVINKPGFPNYYLNSSFETKRYRITSLLYKDPKRLLTVFKDKKNGKDYVFRKTKEGIEFTFLSAGDNAVIMYNNYLDSKFVSEDVLSPRQREMIKTDDPNNEKPFLVIYHLKQ